MDYIVDFIKSFFSNYLIVSAITGWLFAQLVKVIVDLFNKEKFRISNLLFSTGGMPSSHTATVVSLCIACLIQEGATSPLFAITLILAIVVIIDALGVRYETGKQAQVINKITKELFSGKMEEFNTGLKELVGHTPFQVFMGALVGIAVPIVMNIIMNL